MDALRLTHMGLLDACSHAQYPALTMTSPAPQFDPADAVWTVGSLTRRIAALIAQDEDLQRVAVEGEVSRYSVAASGHVYFSLKDEHATLNCVMWRSEAQRQTFSPRQGDLVVARGYIGVYEASGQYQLYCLSLSAAGRGDLFRAFERLRAQLQSEGLFDAERKRPLPLFPQTIGIVTSADAAALQDVLNVLSRRYPLARALLAHTLVQGLEAPPQIVQALNLLDGRSDVDVIVVVRGGGSLEDLAAFNDERVVRAIASARHPVVAGVGHETDFTLADFAADLRAPTPSAAAELATPDAAELAASLTESKARLANALQSNLSEQRHALHNQLMALRHLSPRNLLDNARQRTDALRDRLAGVTSASLSLRRERLNGLQAALDAISPQATLERGYAIVTDESGAALSDARQAPPGTRLGVQLARGSLRVTVDESSNEG